MADEHDKLDQADEQQKAHRPQADGNQAAGEAPDAAAIMGDDGAAAGEPAAKKARIKGGRVPPVGIAHIRSTFNNTTVCITDMRGGVVSWSSAGKAGFKGSRKSTAFAATMVGQDAARVAAAKGMHEVEIRVQGAGAGRESAIRAIQTAGLSVSMIKDITPIPHNGCRPRKRRRV
jgi:small subunit ribosomal protein S11